MTVPTGGIRRTSKEFVCSGLKRTAIGCAFLYDFLMVMHVAPSGISLASSQFASAKLGANVFDEKSDGHITRGIVIFLS